MNCELAKELKDAGFPQKQHPLSCYDNGCYEVMGEACVPTLSELIEACGEGFDLLGKNETAPNEPKEWWAEGNEYWRERGSTPEEAVARLYLALNAKPL